MKTFIKVMKVLACKVSYLLVAVILVLFGEFLLVTLGARESFLECVLTCTLLAAAAVAWVCGLRMMARVAKNEWLGKEE